MLLEAMACGLPVISSDATFAVDLVDKSNGRIFPAGDVDLLVEHLRFFAEHRDSLPMWGTAARAAAEQCTWHRYRERLSAAVAPFC